MSDDSHPSTLAFVLMMVGYAGAVPLGIWQALSFPNITALALFVPFGLLLAWGGVRVVRDPAPSRP